MSVDSPFRQDRAPVARIAPACSGITSSELSDAVLRAIATEATSNAVVLTLVTRLASAYNARRVSIGFQISGETVLKGVSDQIKLDSWRSLPRLLNDVLIEVLDSDSPIRIDAEKSEALNESLPSHVELFELSSTNAIYSFWIEATRCRFAFLMEFGIDEIPSSEVLESMQEAVKPAVTLANVLVYQEQSFIKKLSNKVSRFVNALSRGKLSTRQTLAFGLFTVLALSCVFPVTARVTTKATIVAADSQLIVAPQNGFVQSSSVRAGDIVKSGDLLATLDNRDLRLTADKWQSEALQNQQSQAQALASRDRIELGRLRADMARIEAELALVDRQLLRAELRAPFDGVVTRGDLTQSLGAAVEHGEVLFTVAKASDYRLELDVSERDVALIHPGQSLGVRLSSAPGTGLAATVEELLPVAQSEAGESTFRVQAKLADQLALFRPGMEGIAKIDVGKSVAISVYTRKLRNGLRLLAWKLGLL